VVQTLRRSAGSSLLACSHSGKNGWDSTLHLSADFHSLQMPSLAATRGGGKRLAGVLCEEWQVRFEAKRT
jgi:hypothetical protein